MLCLIVHSLALLLCGDYIDLLCYVPHFFGYSVQKSAIHVQRF